MYIITMDNGDTYKVKANSKNEACNKLVKEYHVLMNEIKEVVEVS